MAGEDKVYIGVLTDAKVCRSLLDAIKLVYSGQKKIAVAPGDYFVTSDTSAAVSSPQVTVLTEVDKPIVEPVEKYNERKIELYREEILDILKPLIKQEHEVLGDKITRIKDMINSISDDKEEQKRILDEVNKISQVQDEKIKPFEMTSLDIDLIMQLPEYGYVICSGNIGYKNRWMQLESAGLVRFKHIAHEGLRADLLLIESLVPREYMDKIELVMKNPKAGK